MKLGCFSVSLAVKDITKSKAFYEKLGFEVYHGQEDQGWVIMKNGDTNIGLFQGMFENNILTFNPGWDNNAQEISDYTDVREIQKALEKEGMTIEKKVETDKGPGHFTVIDPDGNAILIDQHVPTPEQK